MSALSLIGVVFALVAITPQYANAIKCFKCRSETDCAGSGNFRSEYVGNYQQFIDEGCSFNPSYIPACKYVINNKSVVRERRCGDVGVTSRQPFCKNIYTDVVECYCTTDWCNGIDDSNSAIHAAEEHFRRQGDNGVEEKKNEVVSSATSKTLSVFWLALVMGFSSICG